MNKVSKFLFISMTIILFIAIGYFFIKYSKSKRNIRVECRYMAYACGDCYPNYKIEKILEPVKTMDGIVGEDIGVEFDDIKEQKKFDKSTQRCKICFTYEFLGNLEYSIFNKSYVLMVQEYKLNFYKDCCDTTVVQ